MIDTASITASVTANEFLNLYSIGKKPNSTLAIEVQRQKSDAGSVEVCCVDPIADNGGEEWLLDSAQSSQLFRPSP